MKKQYIIGIVLALGIISVLFCYLYNMDQEDIYYVSYEHQINATNNSMILCQSAMSSIILSKFNNNLTNSNITADLQGANSSAVSAIGYSKEMVKNYRTDSEKKYSELLLNQSNDMLKFIDLLSILYESDNDTTKFNEVMKQLETVKTQEESYQKELDIIRSTDSKLDNRLKQIENKIQ